MGLVESNAFCCIPDAIQGLDDLRDGLVRTPLAPKETFLDDPLRVIRTIRFSSRFGYELAQELKDSATSEEIQVRLYVKLSPLCIDKIIERSRPKNLQGSSRGRSG